MYTVPKRNSSIFLYYNASPSEKEVILVVYLFEYRGKKLDKKLKSKNRPIQLIKQKKQKHTTVTVHHQNLSFPCLSLTFPTEQVTNWFLFYIVASVHMIIFYPFLAQNLILNSVVFLWHQTSLSVQDFLFNLFFFFSNFSNFTLSLPTSLPCFPLLSGQLLQTKDSYFHS